MHDNRNISWEDYKKFVVPNKNNKLFEKKLDSPKIITNPENTRLIKNQEFLSNLENKNYNISVANRKTQKHFRSESSIDLHYINTDLNTVLETFFSKCILYGFRYVTIITGKGKGILKNSVILWLKHNSQFVSEYFEIQDSRHECGALGIHLRALKKIR
ncbi:MAG: Smr/MutS family protein [Alphaproteobacteria bacterium]|nr:Smr/MutS family protein [Alphaproteobacteria bacterium]